MTHEGTTEYFNITLVSDKEKTDLLFFIFYISQRSRNYLYNKNVSGVDYNYQLEEITNNLCWWHSTFQR